MIEFMSNFFLKNINEESSQHNLPENTIQYTINSDNVEEKIKTIIDNYKHLKPILVLYSNNQDIKYFLSIFTTHYCNIRSRKQFEDILLMNHCIFL